MEHEEEYMAVQNELKKKIILTDSFEISELKTVAGVDLAYWKEGESECAVCCIVVIVMETHEVLEKKHYSGKIEVSEKREYEPAQDFVLSVIFGPSSFTDYTSDQSNNKTDTIKISKEEAIRITVSAINKTKGYRGELQVDRTQNINVQMTSFNSVSEVTNTITLVRAKINDELNKSNGTSKGTKTFAGGVSGDLTLNDTIPPSGRTASLQPSLVETYSAVKGSGGYVITFTLYPCTSTNDEMSYSLLSIVDGFYFDEDGANAQHKSYYGPTQISIVVNNSGLLSKYSYTITGVADCKFFENNEHVATGEFGFNNRYSYDFKY